MNMVKSKCKYCGGTYGQLQNHNSTTRSNNATTTTSKPNEYNTFVRNNYQRIRQLHPQAGKQEMMKLLAEAYRQECKIAL